MAPGYRTNAQTRRGNRSGFPEHDDFEGLPVRHWRQEWINMVPPAVVEPSQQNDVWAVELPQGMPRDWQLLAPHSQELLRAARSGRLYKRPAPTDDDDVDPDPGADKSEKKEDPSIKGYVVRTWKQVPRASERSTPSYLAKRRRGTLTLKSKVEVLQSTGPLVTRATVRRLDAAGNPYEQTITLTDGQQVDGEIISTSVVPLPNTASGPPTQETATPARRKPPPPRRKTKGPGRGRKKGKLPLPASTRPQPQQGDAQGPSFVEGSSSVLPAATLGSENSRILIHGPDAGETVLHGQEQVELSIPPSDEDDGDEDDDDDEGEDEDEDEDMDDSKDAPEGEDEAEGEVEAEDEIERRDGDDDVHMPEAADMNEPAIRAATGAVSSRSDGRFEGEIGAPVAVNPPLLPEPDSATSRAFLPRQQQPQKTTTQYAATHLALSRAEGSPLKNVVLLSPTGLSPPALSPVGGNALGPMLAGPSSSPADVEMMQEPEHVVPVSSFPSSTIVTIASELASDSSHIGGPYLPVPNQLDSKDDAGNSEPSDHDHGTEVDDHEGVPSPAISKQEDITGQDGARTEPHPPSAGSPAKTSDAARPALDFLSAPIPGPGSGPPLSLPGTSESSVRPDEPRQAADNMPSPLEQLNPVSPPPYLLPSFRGVKACPPDDSDANASNYFEAESASIENSALHSSPTGQLENSAQIADATAFTRPDPSEEHAAEESLRKNTSFTVCVSQAGCPGADDGVVHPRRTSGSSLNALPDGGARTVAQGDAASRDRTVHSDANSPPKTATEEVEARLLGDGELSGRESSTATIVEPCREAPSAPDHLATPKPPRSPPLAPTNVVDEEDDGPDLLCGLEAELDRQEELSRAAGKSQNEEAAEAVLATDAAGISGTPLEPISPPPGSLFQGSS